MTQHRWIPGRRTRIALWLAFSAACAIGAGLPLLRSPEERVLRHAPAVLANVAPGFGLYVDQTLCAECHAAEAAAHLLTGHAQTLRPAVESPLAAALDGKTFQDPERGVRYHYHFDPQAGLSVTVPERLGNDSFPLTYAFGSGRHRMTFLTLIPNRLGATAGIEHRVAVRHGPEGLSLELAPGHAGLTPQQAVEHFGRTLDAATLERCVACHATRGEIHAPEIRGLTPNVGCQKCHGPGREHVIASREAQARGTPPEPRVPPAVREQIRACSRCHLPPGTDDELLKTLPDHIRSVRIQAVELLQSRCFTQSDNRLGCATCHDLHAPVVKDPTHYVQRCLTCHAAPDGVVCPVSPQTDCVRCHLPPVTAEKGAAWHDHRIRKPD